MKQQVLCKRCASSRSHNVGQRALRKVAVYAQATTSSVQQLPRNYDQIIRMAQDSVKAALADGVEVMEIEFPPSGIDSVPGDGEGKTEMDESMKYLRRFLNGFRNKASTTRVFFPEQKEMYLAKYGAKMDPNAGSPDLAPTFGGRSEFQLDYLTKPNFWWDMGLDVGKLDMVKKVRDSDELLIAAYPYFNIQEMIAVSEMYTGLKAKGAGRPIVIFNGELDRIRSGYYSSFTVPRLNGVKKNFMPKVEGVFYMRNIKRPTGTLFRAYPGPWQVVRRNPIKESSKTIWTSDERPELRKVVLDILTNPNL